MPEDRYYLTQSEAGRWNVLDRLTGGPVEINGVVLYELDVEEADDLVDLLLRQDREIMARLKEITSRRENP